MFKEQLGYWTVHGHGNKILRIQEHGERERKLEIHEPLNIVTEQYRDTNNRFKEQLVYTDIMKEQYRLNNLEREQSGNRFKVPVSRDFFGLFLLNRTYLGT